jgi:outer membrane usher protein FimD/PapC
MMSTKEAIFFNTVYIQADSQNTVFISMKYRLHLIYLSLGLSYFLSNVKYVLKASGGVASVHYLLAFSNVFGRYKNRRLLAKDLIENRSHFAKTFTPLKV